MVTILASEEHEQNVDLDSIASAEDFSVITCKTPEGLSDDDDSEEDGSFPKASVVDTTTTTVILILIKKDIAYSNGSMETTRNSTISYSTGVNQESKDFEHLAMTVTDEIPKHIKKHNFRYTKVYSEINGKDLLFITTLDSQKAFDVVNHQILLDKLCYLGVDIEYWDVIEDMYNGVTSTVKWQGDTSLSFSIDQGVRQGGILSSHLYKQYINELLSELETHNMGISVGNTYAGCPSCADDIVLLSNDQNEMQEMLNTVYDYSSDHRFLIHPVKSNTIVKSVNKRTSERIQQTTENFTLGDNIMEFISETTHLGLKRTTSEETKMNITDRISLARRTLYSLDQDWRSWYKWTQPKNFMQDLPSIRHSTSYMAQKP
ncbi:unnamed protein product [Mytilus coruscus]|uniref:Reverse transcriptase domain-containing protein n=1 Tax=Mytilus coruscus TaxID=42192 RepID=A0A6J8BPP1_MYTCO|nr:unnamed protein product [Mytilus coruscus]